MRSADALVIGAGAIGAATAYYLTQAGCKVIVVDAAGVASGATGAAEGIVGSIAKRKAGPVTDIVVRSFSMFPQLSEELDGAIEFTPRGGLTVADDDDDAEVLRRFVAKRRGDGLDIEWLDGDEARALEPTLSLRTVGAIHTPAQGTVNPIQLTHAFLLAARGKGAEVLIAAKVTGFEKVGDRLVATDTSCGRIAADTVINAAGAGAGEVAALAGGHVAIVPKRAHMLASQPIASGTLRHTLYGGAVVAAGLNRRTLEFEDVTEDEDAQAQEVRSRWQLSSFIQTLRGNILFCGGFGLAAADREVDPRTMMKIAQNIRDIAPGLPPLRIIRAWAGIEPCTPDNLPRIGRATEVSNLVHAAGHGNAGVMMSPYTGQLIAELVTTGRQAPTLLALAASFSRPETVSSLS